MYRRKKKVIVAATKRGPTKQDKIKTMKHVEALIDDVASGRLGLQGIGKDKLSSPGASSGNIPSESDVVRTSTKTRTCDPKLKERKSSKENSDQDVESDTAE